MGRVSRPSCGKLQGDKLTGTLTDLKRQFYQGAYADVMGAIDFVSTRDDLDPPAPLPSSAPVRVVGLLWPSRRWTIASQGGSSHVPFLCKLRLAAHAGVARQRASASTRRAAMMTRRARLRWSISTLISLRGVRVPVLMSAGGKDMLCPMVTIQSVFDRLTTDRKTLKTYPDLPHTSCVDFYSISWTWLDQNFRGPTQ